MSDGLNQLAPEGRKIGNNLGVDSNHLGTKNKSLKYVTDTERTDKQRQNRRGPSKA